MKIYLDSYCFNRSYDSQTTERSRGADGKLARVWSFMLDYENSANPYPDHREAIAEWKVLAKQQIPALETRRECGTVIETSSPKTLCTLPVRLKLNVLISSPLAKKLKNLSRGSGATGEKPRSFSSWLLTWVRGVSILER